MRRVGSVTHSFEIPGYMYPPWSESVTEQLDQYFTFKLNFPFCSKRPLEGEGADQAAIKKMHVMRVVNEGGSSVRIHTGIGGLRHILPGSDLAGREVVLTCIPSGTTRGRWMRFWNNAIILSVPSESRNSLVPGRLCVSRTACQPGWACPLPSTTSLGWLFPAFFSSPPEEDLLSTPRLTSRVRRRSGWASAKMTL